jgi:hypothetical protein
VARDGFVLIFLGASDFAVFEVMIALLQKAKGPARALGGCDYYVVERRVDCP